MAALLIFNAESSPRSTARAPCTTRLVDAAGSRGPAVQLRAQRRSLLPAAAWLVCCGKALLLPLLCVPLQETREGAALP